MTERDLQQRLVVRAVSGRYNLFVKLGGLLAAVGAALFVLAVSGGEGTRAWQAFHVNWLFFTGLTAGSLALNAVYKVANAKWAGVIVRFSQATVFFALISLIGCALILTLGYQAIYGPMQEQRD